MVIISNDGASQVLSQLVRQGYFVNDTTTTATTPENSDDEDDGIETYRKWTQRKQQEQNSYSSVPPLSFRGSGWQLIPAVANGNSTSCYFTPKGLVRHLIRRLLKEETSGRCCLSQLCRDAGVDCQLFLMTTPVPGSEDDTGSSCLWNQLVEESVSSSVTILGNINCGATQSIELASATYFEETARKIAAMVEEQGSVRILDLMSLHSLSRDVILNHLLNIEGKNDSSGRIDGKMRLIDDSQRLVSEKTYRSLRLKVLKYFACLEEPKKIDSVCQEQGWDCKQVLDWLKIQLEDQEEKKENIMEDIKSAQTVVFVNGEIHNDAATSGQSAIYLPKSYRMRQKQEILEFVAANGYITMERAVRNYRQGFLTAQITTLIQDAFRDITVFNDGSVFITGSILQQVQAGILDYLSQPSSAIEFLDLQEYLPVELLQSPTTVSSVLENIGFTSPSDGVTVLGDDRVIVIGKEVVQKIHDIHLSQLIQNHAKKRANEIFDSDFTLDDDEDEDDVAEDLKSGRKSGKSSRSKRKIKTSKHNKNKKRLPMDGVSSYLVPLPAVVSVIVEAFPIFQEDLDDTKIDNVKWEDDDEHTCGSSLAAQFCRKAFYSKEFLAQSKRALDAELQRLQSEKNSKAKMSRKDAAAKVRSVEAAFQDAFVTLCYLIQSKSKSILFFSNNVGECFDEESLEKLKDEFLQGPCCDFTCRITQHCLFKEEAEEDCLFTFTHPSLPGEDRNADDISEGTKEFSSGLPRYCTDVAITARAHPQSYLSSPPPREPLPILRESFSGSTGIVLSKMWILCGGECYRGGVRTIKDDEGGIGNQSTHVRPGNIDAFLSYVEENCLTLCGLPYKKLDKRAEKNLLFSRKQQLLGLLAGTDVATDPLGVLEYTIMILFQQVRSLVVSGSLLSGPILEALSRERKIPAAVVAALKMSNEMIKNDAKTVDEDLFSLVKECGLARDISKHDVKPLEDILANY